MTKDRSLEIKKMARGVYENKHICDFDCVYTLFPDCEQPNSPQHDLAILYLLDQFIVPLDARPRWKCLNKDERELLIEELTGYVSAAIC